LATLKKSNS